MRQHIYFLLTLSIIGVIRVASFNLTISPDHVRVTRSPGSVSFTCSADVALAGCQFRWLDYWEEDNKPGPLLELSRGPESRPDPAHLNASVAGYSYHGRGLETGDCGISLQVEGAKVWMVACRVRAVSGGGWKYAWTDLYAWDWGDSLPHTLTPRQTVVLPGGEARFSLKTQEPLKFCRFFPFDAGFLLDFDEGAESRDNSGQYRYLGNGPQSGECGIAIANVSEADNGPFRCYIDTPTEKSDQRFMALVVARPPTVPTLTLAYMGTNVTATCVVKESRPVANISWILGDVTIRQDEKDDSHYAFQDKWLWPWTQGSILQKVTLHLKAQDRGKVLTCKVSHVTLTQPLEVTEIISF